MLDPTDIAGVWTQAEQWAAPGERVYPVPIGRISVGEDALAELPGLICREAPRSALLVVDSTPMRRSGEDLKDLVARQLSARVPLRVLVLPDTAHADLPTAKALVSELAGQDVVISLGSGAVTDIVKYARHLSDSEHLFVSVPTAASVTAYTSALAVLEVDGVKRTLPSRPPDMVVCDLPTLVGAPIAMTRAGFGDVLARGVSYGDWFLASELGMADGFTHVPGRLLAGSEEVLLERAEAVGAGRTEGVRAVMDALLLAGMAMSLANQTAPLSGWEHVISHFLDLTASRDGRKLALHGEQVGVGTLIAARAYERAWPVLDPERLQWQPGEGEIAAARTRIEDVFGSLAGGGALIAEIWRDAEKKLRQWQGCLEKRREFARRVQTGEMGELLAPMVRTAAQIEQALTRAGAPRRFEDLTQPIPAATALAAVRYGHLIRSRFTLGDLLEIGGWLEDRSAAGLLQS